MGGTFSKQKGGDNDENNDENNNKWEKAKLANVLDHIATKYILTQNFKDLENLHNTEYCDKLVVLTGKIINNYFESKDVPWLSQRIENGNINDEMNSKDNIKFTTKENFEKMQDITPLNKERMCNGIAKFYVKIAHLFAAITKTINPRYTYVDDLGIKQTVDLKDKQKIDKDKQVSWSQLSLCSRRIQALMTRQNNENGISIKNNACNMQQKGGDTNSIAENDYVSTIDDIIDEDIDEEDEPLLNDEQIDNIETLQEQIDGLTPNEIDNYKESLSDEPGIPELEYLYWDDFDFTTGKFKGMMEKTKKMYLSDVGKFYKAFTGKDVVPDTIKTFSDIKLKDFHNKKLCLKKGSSEFNKLSPVEKDMNIKWQKSYGPEKTDLFNNYAEHLALMISNTKKYENQLKDILGEIFSYKVDSKNNKKILTINPTLTIDKLDELIEKTRNIIIELYINCEKDFKEGIKLFEAVVQKNFLKIKIEKKQR
tara:strand:- start:1301 stop:2743 length:1443 start_codon:yes stop_codon:yes gene_type:complete